MAHHQARVAALCLVLAACDDGAAGGPPSDAAIDASSDTSGFVLCAHEGASAVTGSGPAGSLGMHHVYVQALSGFCMDQLILTLTAADPLTSPYPQDRVRIHALVTGGSLGGSAQWSGTFAATILGPDEVTSLASGTLQVDQATPIYVRPTHVRATARFDNNGWRFTATVDAPYCTAVTCF